MPEPIIETTTRLSVATEAIVKTHDDEIQAYLAGEMPANQWRPERYAAAVLRAIDALPGEDQHA